MRKLYNQINSDVLKAQRKTDHERRITLSFYVYAHILNPSFFRDHLYIQFNDLDICGRIYVASEGVNAQLDVPERNYERFEKTLNDTTFFQNMRINVAIDKNAISFYKLIIRLKHKILADGLQDESFDVTKRGTHIDAMTFNELTKNDDTVIVDMRNHYESEVGHFQNAICPDVETFRESLPIVEELLGDKKDKPLVMYCTGGIRCEKASAYFKHKGFEEVYQLDGGIIEYARTVDALGLENKFKGKNFVFDERMGERISEDIIARCHQCGKPCDTHINCANNACHILFIQCETCASAYHKCCSKKCAEFNTLSSEQKKELRKSIQFNGTKFGKGRYKALTAKEELDIS